MNTHNHTQDDFDNRIKQASIADEQPGAELNNLLKTKVRQKEALLLAGKTKRKISLWYLPMLLNSFVFITINLMLHVFVQNGTALRIMNGVCIYFSIAGVILTIAGIYLANFKTALTFEWSKGGSLA